MIAEFNVPVHIGIELEMPCAMRDVHAVDIGFRHGQATADAVLDSVELQVKPGAGGFLFELRQLLEKHPVVKGLSINYQSVWKREATA